MGILIDWVDENQTALQYTLSGEWTWEELEAAIQRATELLDSSTKPVYVIIDMRRCPMLPFFHLQNLRTIANAPTTNHPNNKGFLVVGANRFIRSVTKIFQQYFPDAFSRYTVLQSSDELSCYLNTEDISSSQ